MFSHDIDTHVRQFHRIQSASSLFWSLTSMGRYPGEMKSQIVHGKKSTIYRNIRVPWMEGKGCITTIKGLVFCHDDFPIQKFFLRASIKSDGSFFSSLFQIILHGQSACISCGPNEIVTAGMCWCSRLYRFL